MPAVASRKSRVVFAAFLIAAVAVSAALYLIYSHRATEQAPSAKPLIEAKSSESLPETESTPGTPKSEALPGAIAGVVRWADTQKSAGGIRVIAEARNISILETMSDDQGAFIFPDVIADVEYTIRAQGVSGGPFSVDDRHVRVAANELVEDQDIAVWSGASIGGRVLRADPSSDIRDGTPLPAGSLEAVLRSVTASPAGIPLEGVRVRLAPLDASPDQSWEVEAVTDANGEFQFEPVSTGNYHVEADPPADAVVMRKGARRNSKDVTAAPDEEAVIRLEFSFRLDTLTLEGRVLDDQGHPLAGVMVTAKSRGGNEGGDSELGNVTTITSADGKYAIDGVASAGVAGTTVYSYAASSPADGAYTLTASKDGHAARQVVVPMVTAPMVSAVQGLIREAERANVAGVKASRPPAIPASHGHVIEVPDLVLDSAATIAGRVVDTSGQALVGVTVTAHFSPALRWEPLKPTPILAPEPFETGPEGRFRMSSVAAGAYDFTVMDSKTGIMEGTINRAVRVKPGDVLEDVTLIVAGAQDRGTIRGRVIDAQSRTPVEEFQVEVTHLESLTDPRGALFGSRDESVTSPGDFVIRRVCPGRAEIRVSAKGFPLHWAVTDVQAGGESEVLIELQRGAAIEGVVTKDGKPVEGAYLSLTRMDMKITNLGQGASSEASGAYEMKELEPAEYRVKVQVGMNTPFRFERATVRLQPGETARVDFQFSGGCRIEGTFTFPSDYHRGLVYLLDSRNAPPAMVDGKLMIRDQTIASTRLEQSGAFVLDDLPPGDYLIIGVGVRPRTIPNGTTIATDLIPVEKNVSVREGSLARVDLTIP